MQGVVTWQKKGIIQDTQHLKNLNSSEITNTLICEVIGYSSSAIICSIIICQGWNISP